MYPRVGAYCTLGTVSGSALRLNVLLPELSAALPWVMLSTVVRLLYPRPVSFGRRRQFLPWTIW